jgi:hypothetical protein
MKVQRLSGKETFGEGRVFTGMDISGLYLDDSGKYRDISFHYSFYTNDLRGIVEQVLHSVLKRTEVPKHVTNLQVDQG